MTIGKIIGVAVLDNHRISVSWDDDVTGDIDFSALGRMDDLFTQITAGDSLSEVMIAPDNWSLAWPSGVDFGAEQLRAWAAEQGALRSAITGARLAASATPAE